MPTSYGEILGQAASQNMDQRTNDLYKFDELRRRAEATAAAQAKMFVEEFSQGPTGSAFDDQIIKDFTRQKQLEAAQVVKSTPNWQYNVDALARLKQINNEVKGNAHVLRAAAYVDAKKKLMADLAEVSKNPNMHDQEAYNMYIQELKNYDMYGHQKGKEAAEKEGPQPFVYQKPMEFVDPNNVFRDVGSKLQANEVEYLKNGRDGAYRTYIKDDDLYKEAQAIYAARPRQWDVMYGQKGIDPIKAIADGLRPYVKTDFHIGQRNTLNDDLIKMRYAASLKMASEKNKAGIDKANSPYRISILNTDITSPAPEDLANTFGSDIAHFIKTPDGKWMKNTGDTFHYDGQIWDKGLGSKGYRKTGVKQASGYIVKPLTWGEEQGYLYDPWFSSDLKVKDEFKDMVEIVDTPPNQKGESGKVLKIKAMAEMNANDPYYEAKFNKMFLTTKQREGVGVEENLNKQVPDGAMVDSVGNVFDASGKYIGKASDF